MAAQTYKLGGFGADEEVLFTITYDDASLLVLTFTVANGGALPAWGQAGRTDTGQSVSATIPAGATRTWDVSALGIVGAYSTKNGVTVLGFPIAVAGRYPA